MPQNEPNVSAFARIAEEASKELNLAPAEYFDSSEIEVYYETGEAPDYTDEKSLKVINRIFDEYSLSPEN